MGYWSASVQREPTTKPFSPLQEPLIEATDDTALVPPLTWLLTVTRSSTSISYGIPNGNLNACENEIIEIGASVFSFNATGSVGVVDGIRWSRPYRLKTLHGLSCATRKIIHA